MKAKDTVMGDNDTVYIAENGTAYTIAILKSQCVSNVNPKWVNENIDLIREAQAAMSFRAGIKEGYNAGLDDATHDVYNAVFDDGKQAGIKEVVEWVMSHQDGFMAGQDVQVVAGNECTYGNTSHLLVRWLEWQSKLEEWEIA